MDDFSFSEMTLKQLKERCKTKKRKFPKSFNLKKEPCSHLNEDNTKLQLKEDESDLEETLSSWKLKLSKKPKAIRKCIRKEVHSPSESTVTVPVSEQTSSVPQEDPPPQSKGDLNGSIETKIEISDCDDMKSLTFGATPNTCSTADTCTIYDEVTGFSIRSELAVEESTSLTAESPNRAVTEVSIEYLEHENSLSQPASAAIGETMEGSLSEVISQETLSSSISKLDANVRIIQSTPNASPVKAPSITNKPAYEMCGSWEDNAFMQETSCEIDCSSVFHMLHKLNGDNLRCMETNYDGGYILNMESEGGSKEDTLPDSETHAIKKSTSFTYHFKILPCSNSLGDFSSIDCCSSPTTEGKQNHLSLSIEGPVSAGLDGENEGHIKEDNPSDPETSVTNTGILYTSPQNCHTYLTPSNLEDFKSATDVKNSFPTKEGPLSNISRVRDCCVGSNPSDDPENRTAIEVLENFHVLKLESHPKRLFTTRKSLRLCFEEQSKIRASSARSELEGVKVKVNLRRIILKPKNGKSKPNLLVPKGILKSPNVSCAIPSAATENSVHPHAESAIAFSQHQMHDIECLAMKLVKELKFIKDIVEDKMHSEVCPSTSSKYTVDEMTVAVHKAGEVEETTRKWLSMMVKDCSRFCKIMRSSGKKAPAATICYGLEDRRIIFADEAGGPLCHVKVFENQLTSHSGSEC
ncbi:hypothetical protein NE237_018707 [Protea cynaroides]|uniref:Uncharacterized protein n=1 Tax=Protea cynaroides TaxID=273540 RepID=A0A9Q0KAD8_9MAGN|nr:hypothetical protein NE237_018707 [Protea cynaroides]